MKSFSAARRFCTYAAALSLSCIGGLAFAAQPVPPAPGSGLPVSQEPGSQVSGAAMLASSTSANFNADSDIRVGNGISGAGETLEDFFTAAMDYSPRLNIAQQRWNIGTARKRAANGQLLPQINANTSISDNRQTAQGQLSAFRGERYSVQLSQVLFNWQAFAQRSQAYLLEDQFEAEYYFEVAWLLTEVADRYFNVLQAQEALTSVESELNALSRQAEQIQRMYDLRIAQITDLYDVQARLAAVQSDQLDLISSLALSREALHAVTGLSVGSLYQLNDSVNIPALENGINEWVTRARANNQQIQAREFALQAADKHISERRGAYMPRVSLIVQQQRSNLGFDNVPINRTDSGYVGIDVSVPLFAGGSNRAGVSEAQSQQNLVESELRQVELEVDERTRTAYLQVKSYETRTDSARKLVEATQLSATARQRGFELGVVSSVDVLNALRDQYQAERELQETRYEHIKTRLLLRREAGTLSAEDLLDVGSWLIPSQQAQ